MGRKKNNKNQTQKQPVKMKAFKQLEAKNFSVQVPMQVYAKIMHWIKKAKNDECSGFGTVTYEQGKFAIQDAFMLKQKNNPSHTEIDAASLGKLEYEVHKNNLKGDLLWWWHSHVQMRCYWSSTDMDTIRELGYNGWITATVFNQKGEHRSAFMQKINMLGQDHEIFLDDLKTTFPYLYNPDEETKWDKEFKENVVEKPKVIYPHVGYGMYNAPKKQRRNRGNGRPPVYIPQPGESLLSISKKWVWIDGHRMWMKQKGNWEQSHVWSSGSWIHVDALTPEQDHYLLENSDKYPEMFLDGHVDTFDDRDNGLGTELFPVDYDPYNYFDDDKTLGENIANHMGHY